MTLHASQEVVTFVLPAHCSYSDFRATDPNVFSSYVHWRIFELRTLTDFRATDHDGFSWSLPDLLRRNQSGSQFSAIILLFLVDLDIAETK
jgi:hypothetical protein